MRFLFIVTSIILIHLDSALATPNYLTYQGRILKSNGQPLEYNSVSFLFQILSSDGSCLVYQEQKNGHNMVNSKGLFDVPIGSGSVQFPTSGGFSIIDAFNNSNSVNCGVCTSSGLGYNCSNSGSQYTPALADGRILRVSFYDGSAWQLISPDSVIRSVPYAGFAATAMKLGAYTATDFVVKTGIPTCAASEFLTWNGSSLSCAAVGGAAGGTVMNVSSANSYISVANPTSNPVLTLNVGTTAGTVAAGNDSRIANALQSSTVFSGDISGNYSAVSVDKIKGVAVSGPAPTTGQVLKFDGTNWAASNPTLGTVTSVGLSVPSFLSVSGGPVTSSGTLAVSLASQSANTVFAAPNGSSGSPTFRTLKIGDIFSTVGGLSFLNTTPACTGGTALTYVSATDRIECATVSAAWASISGKPTTLAGYGITDAASSSSLTSYVAKAGDTMTGALQFPNGTQAAPAITFSSESNTGLYRVSSGVMGIAFNGTSEYSISNGSIRSNMSNTFQLTNGNTVSFPTYSFNGDTDTGIFHAGANTIGVSTSGTERLRIDSTGKVGIGVTAPSEALEVSGNIKGTQLCIGADCRSAWPTASGGTVTNVSSANAYLTVTNGGTTPTITANVGTVANTLAAGNDSRFTDSRAPSGSASGDLGGTYPGPSVNKIRGFTVASTTPLDGQVYRYNNSTTQFEPVYFGVDDLRTSVGASQFSTSCTSSQTLTWSAVTDAFTCANIANLDAGVIATGTIANARLPASATYWSAATGGINYAGGNVGIGTTTPGQKLSVAGVIESTSGGIKFPDGSTQSTAFTGMAGSAGSAVAWVAFNAAGTIASSFNVASVTKSSTGRYVVNFSNTLSDSNYAVVFGGVNTAVSDGGWVSVDNTSGSGKTTSSVKLITYHSNGTVMDYPEVYVAIFQGSGTAAIANGQWTQAGNDVYRVSGNVGMGTTTPLAPLDVVRDTNGWVRVQNSSSDTNGAALGFYKSRGTVAAPTAVQSGDRLAGIYGTGYHSGAAFGVNSGAVQILAAENFTATAQGSKVDFGTTPLGSTTRVTRMTVDSTGFVGIGTASPNRLIHGVRNADDNLNTDVGVMQLDRKAVSGTPANGIASYLQFGLPNSANTVVLAADIGAKLTDVTPGAEKGDLILRSTVAGNATERMRIIHDGNVGVGTSTPIRKLHVNGDVQVDGSVYGGLYGGTRGIWRFSSADPNFGIFYTEGSPDMIDISPNGGGASTPVLRVRGDGNATLTGTLTQSSDLRLKRDISSIQGSLNKIVSLQGVTYKWKDSSRDQSLQIGLIAQEVEKVFPEAVKTNEDGFKSVAYQVLVAPIINSIKELYRELTQQQQQIEELKKTKQEVEELKKKNEAMEQALCQMGRYEFCKK